MVPRAEVDWVDAKALHLNFLLLLFPFLLLSHETGIVTHTLIPVGIYNAGPLGTLIPRKQCWTRSLLPWFTFWLLPLMPNTLSPSLLPPATGCSFYPMVVPTDHENTGYCGGHLYPALRSRTGGLQGLLSAGLTQLMTSKPASTHLSISKEFQCSWRWHSRLFSSLHMHM